MHLRLSTEQQYWIIKHTNRLEKRKTGFLKFAEVLAPVWKLLQEAEFHLVHFTGIEETGSGGGDIEFALGLYIMNHLIPEKSTAVFKRLGMPASTITPEQWEQENLPFIIPAKKAGGIKTEDGSLVLDIPFALLDPGWASSLICYIFNQLGVIKTHAFNNTPQVITPLPEQERLTIAVLGDWGTGYWKDGKYDCPATLVASAIRQSPVAPDIIIHLGDVYYSGRKREEKINLIADFPAAKSGLNCTLNSNHEVYDGSNGYYKVALTHQFFDCQKNTSFFAISFKDWVIIGLDTAYYDRSPMVKAGALSDGNATQQKDFIKSLDIKPYQKIIVVTHHHAMDFSGKSINETLNKQVFEALGNVYPDYWYYGHLHNGIVYNEQSAIGAAAYKTRSGKCPQLRCVGNSAIPVGRAELEKNAGVDYFVRTAIPVPDTKQQKRVLNGYAVMVLGKNTIREEIYEVSPVDGPIIAWHKG